MSPRFLQETQNPALGSDKSSGAFLSAVAPGQADNAPANKLPGHLPSLC
jgi:hypothetical protein